MPTGSPDFGQNPASNQSSPSFDTGEDTTRILMGGGAQSRGGRWIFATGFEGGLNDVALFGNAAPTLDITKAFMGQNSLKLSPPAVVNNQSIVGKYYFTQGNRNGYEFNFAFDSIASSPNFDIVINVLGPYKDTGKQAIGQIVIGITGVNSGKLYYFDSGLNKIQFATVNEYIEDINHYWHYAKLVFDIKNNQYARFYFDNQIIDMGGVAGMINVTNSQYCANRIHLVTLGAYSPIMRVDNMIITTDEP